MSGNSELPPPSPKLVVTFKLPLPLRVIINDNLHSKLGERELAWAGKTCTTEEVSEGLQPNSLLQPIHLHASKFISIFN